MKTPEQIKSLCGEFNNLYGFCPSQAEQGSGMWMASKLGVLSASNASKIVAGRSSETRFTYMASLVGQVATGEFPEINSKYLEWGTQNEDAARSCYEFSTGNTVTCVPFIYRDNTFREGCSPDGLVSTVRGAEIKCPYTTVEYIKFVVDARIKREWQWQAQYSMRVLDAGEWDFVQYDPRMATHPVHVVTLERNTEMQKELDDKVPAFIADMDTMLSKIGVEWGDQWKNKTWE